MLAWLGRDARVSAAPSVFNVDEYVLRAHPDLADALRQAAGPRAPHCEGAAYGYPLLAVGGIIFAVAMSMRHLLFRLPETSWPFAVEMGGRPAPEAGPEWMVFDAWEADVPGRQHADDLRFWCERAFERAQALAR